MLSAQHLLVFAVRDTRVVVHRHHCFQVILSVDGPFESTVGGDAYRQRTALVVGQNVPHACSTRESRVLVYFIDAESLLGWQVRALLGGQPFLEAEALFTPEQRERFYGPANQSLPVEGLRRMAGEILEALLPAAPEAPRPDPRIEQAIRFIEAELGRSLALEEVAERVGLSPERTRHLFAQATGVPFSQFVLWRRLKSAVTLAVGGGRTLTEAAMDSGFADQAHFCRVFKRTFGISAKGLLKNSRSVQFLSPPA